MKGLITHIQQMSVHDGEGIRTTVFLKGCDLRCRWCHNPETLSCARQLEWIANKCIGCGKCLSACSNGALSCQDGKIIRDTNRCILCGECVSSCCAGARNLIGTSYSVQDLCDVLESDRMVFEISGGGVTISGGEPMLQFDFLLELVTELHSRSINVCLQTNLNAPWSRYELLLPYLDHLMGDLKHIDPEAHRRLTGKDNHNILENIRKLDNSGATYTLRTPVIPGVNDSEEVLGKMSDFASRLKNISRYELLPFHPLADYKYRNLGMEYEFAKISPASTESFRKLKQKFEFNSDK